MSDEELPLREDLSCKFYSADDDGEVDGDLGREETYTVEQAVENMGFGKFQMKIFFICGLFSVS